METLDWLIIFIIICVILFFGAIFISFHQMKKACESVGGELSGSLDCRKGNVFYEIYPTKPELTNLFNYTVNKYPKTER